MTGRSASRVIHQLTGWLYMSKIVDGADDASTETKNGVPESVVAWKTRFCLFLLANTFSEFMQANILKHSIT